jgi:hypothetical protein
MFFKPPEWKVNVIATVEDLIPHSRIAPPKSTNNMNYPSLKSPTYRQLTVEMLAYKQTN